MDPYRIQEFSRAYVQDGPEADWAPDSEMAAKLGQCAFDHGLKMEQVLDVLAIELRDQLLELTGREPPGQARGQPGGGPPCLATAMIPFHLGRKQDLVPPFG